MLSPQINIGPLTIHIYGLVIGVAIYIGWLLAKRRAHLYKIPKDIFDSFLIFIPLTTALFLARLYHVLDYRHIYFKNPITMLFVQNGGLGIWGAIFGAILGVLIVSRIRKINFMNLLDLLAPSFALGQAIGRFGNFVNQEGFGPPTNLPWGIYINQNNRPLPYLANTHFHPTFFYESILDLIIFLLLLILSKKFKFHGQIFALYLILYSAARFFLEFVRIDTWVTGDIKIAQVISILAIIMGLVIFFHSKTLDLDTS